MKKLGGNPFHIGQSGVAPLERFSDMSAELLSCEVRLKGEDAYGHVNFGKIILRSLFLPLSGWKSGCEILLTSSTWKRGFQLAQPGVNLSWNANTEQVDLEVYVTHRLICHFNEPLSHPDWRSEDMTVYSDSLILYNMFLLHISNFDTMPRGGGYRGYTY